MTEGKQRPLRFGASWTCDAAARGAGFFLRLSPQVSLWMAFGRFQIVIGWCK